MAVIKEWKCAKHGPFEGSHPICEAFGCDSKDVVREIRTAPSIGSAATRRTDAGLRRTADAYGIDLRSAKEGESSKVQRGGMIWGLDTAGKALGAPSIDAMLHKPMTFERKGDDGKVEKFVDKFGGIQHAAGLVGNMDLFKSKVETTYHKADKKPV